MMLKTKLTEIQGRLTLEHFPNEAAVSQGIVIPILRELNWDTDNPRVVYPEHTAGGGGRADFALCDGSGNPKIFIEVKKIGGDLEDGLKKLMQYAQSADVHIVVLTDGRTWSFYLPFEAGKDKEKRVFKLDLSEHSAQESSEVLQRYLEKDRVVSVSGEVLETARVFFFLEKYPERSDRAAEWAKVNGAIDKFESARNFLVEALKEDIKPKPAQNNIAHGVVDYFHSLLRKKISHHQAVPTAQPTNPEAEGQISAQLSSGVSERKQPVQRRDRQVSAQLSSGVSERKQPVQHRDRQVSAPPPSGASGGGRSGKLVILGKSFPCKNPADAMAIVLQELQKRKGDLYERVYESDWNWGKHRTRRRIAPSPEELYPAERNRHLRRYCKKINNNWVVSTNYKRPAIENIIKHVTEVAGLVFGKDIIINFDD